MSLFLNNTFPSHYFSYAASCCEPARNDMKSKTSSRRRREEVTGPSEMADQAAAEKEYAEKLLRMVKKEVKQIMEEAVTRKFVHEESSSITSLCSAVDACLSHGLKRRALGLFKTNSTTALLQKVAKNFEPASLIARRVADIESADPNKRSSSSSDSTCKLKNSQTATTQSQQLQGQNSVQSSQQQMGSPSNKKLNQVNPRFLWIRLALFEKLLAKIVDHLVQNSSKYYEKEALVADPVTGQILASLLVGPCALDYSKMKTQDHFWTDPPADELVQRHRLSSAHPLTTGCPSTPPSVRRLGLQYRKDIRMSSSDDSVRSAGSHHRSPPISARDYVDSLHQNSKSTLLYGKNNVYVQPREHLEPMPGYFSLHQTPESLMIKWTPNQLMNGCTLINDSSSSTESTQDKSTYWDYAMCFNVEDIVYLHCHQQADSGGTIVLVGLDGVQHPPIHFPKGGHMLALLSCLENGLLPHGQLDPPLWSQRGKGKVFPKLRRRGRGSIRKQSKEPCEDGTVEEEEEASDYVFRIITSLKPDSISQEMMDPKMCPPPPLSAFSQWHHRGSILNNKTALTNGNGAPPSSPGTPPASSSGTVFKPSLKHKFSSSSSTSTSSSKSVTEEMETAPPSGQSIQLLCDTMKRQIISRAFYGWLAYCRHLRTVRTHLAGLVHQNIVSLLPEFETGLTEELWRRMQSEEGKDSGLQDAAQFYKLTYFGGVQHSIRKEVWPYLLGHYHFGSTNAEREEQDSSNQTSYETVMSEWLAVEAIVRQRDKEIMAANLAKLSSESTNSEIPLVGPKDANLSNEVFEDISTGDSFDHPEDEDIPEEDETQVNTELPFKQEGDQITNGKPEPVSTESTPTRVPLLRHCQVESRSIIVTNPSVDMSEPSPTEAPKNSTEGENPQEGESKATDQEGEEGLLGCGETLNPADLSSTGGGDASSQLSSRSSCISPASSSGGVYSMDLLDLFSLNIHRIDKDVQRCDRNYWYFTPENLEKLRNVMCTYVWEHLDIGYVQGMCDLVAPLLVVFDDEVLTYSCFCKLMLRMAANFPHGGAMDAHFANMRSLIQILDGEIFELMHQNGDYTHFYFCYRWFLLDFKRELVYDDVFSVWETIWASQHVASSHFVLFIALALVEYYRDIILENNMDFTDIIKFFNEMAERHDAKAVLKVARDLVLQIQTLIDNK